MRKHYRAFLLASATDQPTRAFVLNRRAKANELVAAVRKWDKVVSNLPH